MKKGYLKILIILTLYIILFLVNIFVKTYASAKIEILLLLSMLILLIYLFGYEKNKQRFQKDMIMNIFILMLIYYFAIYLFGLKIGFVRTGYSLKIFTIIKNIVPAIILIVLSEFVRYEVTIKGKDSKLIYILEIVLFIIVDISLYKLEFNLNNLEQFIKFVGVIVLPSLFKNSMLVYVTYKFGMKVSIFYRLIKELPSYFIPIFPNLGVYLMAIIDIILPFIIIAITYLNFDKKKEKIETRSKKKDIIYVTTIFILLSIVGLVSGKFKYYALTIGSGSMVPHINKGDVVIVEKDTRNLDVGDIIAFRNSGKIITHRIVDILSINNKNYYYTKGDYNENRDNFVTKEEDIVGVVKLRILYLGYPTVWLNERMGSD